MEIKPGMQKIITLFVFRSIFNFHGYDQNLIEPEINKLGSKVDLRGYTS